MVSAAVEPALVGIQWAVAPDSVAAADTVAYSVESSQSALVALEVLIAGTAGHSVAGSRYIAAVVVLVGRDNQSAAAVDLHHSRSAAVGSHSAADDHIEIED